MGNLLYLLAMDDSTWYVGLALVAPLAILLIVRLPDSGGGAARKEAE